jgi:hypothetical protein
MIEINRVGSEYIYRVNEYNKRQIERRKNRHNARWKHYQYALTEEAATKMLFSLQNDKDEE